MTNPLHTYILYIGFDLVAFYGISIIVGYTYILNMHDLFSLGFMEYKPLLVI